MGHSQQNKLDVEPSQPTQPPVMFEQLGLIGCGLMGSSFALALRQAGLVRRIVGYSKSPLTTARALQMGVIDVQASCAPLAVAGSDLVLLAIPVSAMHAAFEAIGHLVNARTLVMDVGSTKCDVVDAARRGLHDQAGSFVPCHPIAGKQVSGVEHADADLYAGRRVVVTPTVGTLDVQLQKAEALWAALGCHITRMSPQDHDAAYAAVSHLPHLIAFAVVNGIFSQAAGKAYLDLAGPGFRDFTRIAASDPQMWRDILLANRDELLAQSRIFQQSLLSLEQLISSDSGDALESQIRQASEIRANWQISSQNALK